METWREQLYASELYHYGVKGMRWHHRKSIPDKNIEKFGDINGELVEKSKGAGTGTAWKYGIRGTPSYSTVSNARRKNEGSQVYKSYNFHFAKSFRTGKHIATASKLSHLSLKNIKGRRASRAVSKGKKLAGTIRTASGYFTFRR